MKQDVIMDRYTEDKCPLCKKPISSDREKNPIKWVMYKGIEIAVCAHHHC